MFIMKQGFFTVCILSCHVTFSAALQSTTTFLPETLRNDGKAALPHANRAANSKSMMISSSATLQGVKQKDVGPQDVTDYEEHNGWNVTAYGTFQERILMAPSVLRDWNQLTLDQCKKRCTDLSSPIQCVAFSRSSNAQPGDKSGCFPRGSDDMIHCNNGECDPNRPLDGEFTMWIKAGTRHKCGLPCSEKEPGTGTVQDADSSDGIAKGLAQLSVKTPTIAKASELQGDAHASELAQLSPKNAASQAPLPDPNDADVWANAMRVGSLLTGSILVGLTAYAGQKSQTSDQARTEMVTAVAFIVLSAMTFVANKYLLVLFPRSAGAIFLQHLFAAVCIRLLSQAGFVDLGSVSWSELGRYVGVPITFCFLLYANSYMPAHAAPSAGVLVRCLAPLVTAPADVYFFGRTWPSEATWASLAVMLSAAIVGAVFDADFALEGLLWGGLWLCGYLFDMVYIKHVFNNVPMTDWARTYYCSAISAIICFVPASLEWYSMQDQPVLSQPPQPVAAAGCLLLSCALGPALLYFMLKARSLLTTTGASVLLTTSKFVTMIVHAALCAAMCPPEDRPAVIGIAMLFLSVVAAMQFKESPARILPDEVSPAEPEQPLATSDQDPGAAQVTEAD